MYTATQCYSAADKEKFVKHFHRFVKSGFKKTLFHKNFYKHLSCMFGHIAHFNVHGFYATWFETPEDIARFWQNVKMWRCPGDPAFCWCDVEKVIQAHYKGLDY